MRKQLLFNLPILLVLLILCAIPGAEQGPITLAICSAGCASLVVACYAAAGFVFGTVTAGAGTPAAIIACNVAFGKCMAAAAAAAALTPI